MRKEKGKSERERIQGRVKEKGERRRGRVNEKGYREE